MGPETLKSILNQKHRDAGLYLEEPDDHLVHLKRGDKILTSFYQTVVTVVQIRKEADYWMDK